MFRLSLVFWAAAVGMADQYPRQAGVDVQHYIFNVTLRDDSSEIAGETTVQVRFLQQGLASWELDFAAAMKVSAVNCQGATVTYTHQNSRLRIQLIPPATAGETRTFIVSYRGIPAEGLRAVKNKFGERTYFSTNWPDLAHQWLPVIDHPYDKATSEFMVTAPAEYQVVANGTLVEQIDLEAGRRMTHWNESVPIPVWQNNIGVARFAWREFGTGAGVPLQTWMFRRDRDKGIATFDDPTRQAMEFYTASVGQFPYEKLADVETAGLSGAMEHASAIFFGEGVVTGKPEPLIVWHEIAHQWFGDSVTENDWDDVWLSEGFATYFALLTAEHVGGRELLLKGVRSSRDRIFAAEKRLPGIAVVQDKPWRGIPNEIVYQKGAWVLHMLRGTVGDVKFWTGMREYYRRFRDGNASTADLENVMEEAAGTKLDWFFRQWLYRAGSPVLQGGWRYERARLVIELEQTQAGEPYRLPLELSFANQVVNVEMTEKRQSFEIPTETEPASVTVDPGAWLLAEVHFARR